MENAAKASMASYSVEPDECRKCKIVEPTKETPKFPNPAAIGLCGFALTTFVLSCYNAHWYGIHVPHVVCGLALFYGGTVQLIAGIMEWIVGNVLGATAFMSYGGFWLSFGMLTLPSAGLKGAYGTDIEAYEHAMGFYLLAWCIFTLIMLVCFSRSNYAMIILFILVAITFLLLSIGKFSGNDKVFKAGGWFGVSAALVAWYCALANLVNNDKKLNKFFTVPLGVIKN